MKDSYAHIDELVRARLNDLPLAKAPTAGWEALERALDAPEDAQLRNALTGLATGTAATGWQALESKLDVRIPGDAKLAEKLNNLQPAVTAGSWDILSERIERENAAAVDVIVSDGLAKTTSIVSSGWAALAARLELIGWRRSTIAAWKVTESALLLSLILLFFRFSAETPRIPVPVAELNDGFPMPVKSADVIDPGEQTAVAREPATDVLFSIPAAPRVAKVRASALHLPIPMPTSGEFTLLSDGGGTQVQGPVSESSTEPYLPELVATLAIRPLKNKLPLPSPMLNLAEIDNSTPVYYYANGFVSPLDVNQVVTPGHIAGEYNINSERRYTTGFTAGGLLDVNKGRNTLQVGIIYSRRSYLPASLKWKYQDYFTPRNPIEGYSKFVYHAIEFPFNYKFTVTETSNWRISARAGMSLSVIAKPEIQDKDEVVAKLEVFEEGVAEDGYGSGSNFIPLPGGRAPLPETQSDFSSEHALKDPPKGWLEGGSILANSSFYLGGGIIVERIMTPRWSIYVSPSFGRVIYLRDGDGVGPYRDRIHLGSVRMGSRYRFGGKK